MAPIGPGPCVAWAPGIQAGPRIQATRGMSRGWQQCGLSAEHSASVQLLWAHNDRLCRGPPSGRGAAPRSERPDACAVCGFRADSLLPQRQTPVASAAAPRVPEKPLSPRLYSTPTPWVPGPPGQVTPCLPGRPAEDSLTPGTRWRRFAEGAHAPLPSRRGRAGGGPCRAGQSCWPPAWPARSLTPVGHYLARDLPGAALLRAVGELIVLFSDAADRPGQSLTRLLPALPAHSEDDPAPALASHAYPLPRPAPGGE